MGGACDSAVCSYAAHGEAYRVQQDGKIHEEVTMVDVVQVILNIFVDGMSAVSADLPQAGDTLLDAESLALHRIVLLYDERHLWARPNE